MAECITSRHDAPSADAILDEVRRIGGGSLHEKVTSALMLRYPLWKGSDSCLSATPTALIDGVANLVAISGKGKGAVAARNITAGELIIAEASLVRSRPGSAAESAVEALGDAERSSFFGLCNGHGERFGSAKTVQAIWLTNAYPIGDGEQAIFPVAARMNHACRPVAFHRWDASTQTHRVTATQPIAKGDELTVCYCKEGTRDERRAFLQSAFGFCCSCEACLLSGAELAQSDVRQQRLQALDAQIARATASPCDAGDMVEDMPQLLRMLSERVELMELEGVAEAAWARGTMEEFLAELE